MGGLDSGKSCGRLWGKAHGVGLCLGAVGCDVVLIVM